MLEHWIWFRKFIVKCFIKAKYHSWYCNMFYSEILLFLNSFKSINKPKYSAHNRIAWSVFHIVCPIYLFFYNLKQSSKGTLVELKSNTATLFLSLEIFLLKYQHRSNISFTLVIFKVKCQNCKNIDSTIEKLEMKWLNIFYQNWCNVYKWEYWHNTLLLCWGHILCQSWTKI